MSTHTLSYTNSAPPSAPPATVFWVCGGNTTCSTSRREHSCVMQVCLGCALLAEVPHFTQHGNHACRHCWAVAQRQGCSHAHLVWWLHDDAAAASLLLFKREHRPDHDCNLDCRGLLLLLLLLGILCCCSLVPLRDRCAQTAAATRNSPINMHMICTRSK